MKKFLLYFFAFVFICFLMPALLTKQDKPVNSEKIEENGNNSNTKNEIKETGENGEYQYKNYGKIQLLHKKTGEIEEVDLDQYLCHVVSAEMPADYEKEALKAQAVVARTYTIYKVKNKKHENADICDDSTCCQAWISKQKEKSLLIRMNQSMLFFMPTVGEQQNFLLMFGEEVLFPIYK